MLVSFSITALFSLVTIFLIVLKLLWKNHIWIHYFYTFTGAWVWRLNCIKKFRERGELYFEFKVAVDFGNTCEMPWMWWELKTQIMRTQIFNYSKNSYFQKIRLNIENPGKLFWFPRFKFSLKPSDIPASRDGNPSAMDLIFKWNTLKLLSKLRLHFLKSSLNWSQLK